MSAITARRAAVWGGALTALVALVASRAPAASPSTIYLYDLDQGSAQRNALMASLSGLVARTSADVALGNQFTNSLGDPEFWVDRYIDDHPEVSKVWQGSVPWFIDRYKSQINGYVIYDAGTINQATSVAGALGAIMVDESLLAGSVGQALATAGLSQTADVRGRDSQWVYDTYGPLFNKNLIFRQQPQFAYQLRSYAVFNAGFMFNETGAARDQFLAGQNDHSLVLGWGYNNDEAEFFGSASQNNLMGVPADHLHSSAAPAQWDVTLPAQSKHTPLDEPTQSNSHYVAFVMSDGDNVQWLTNDFARSARWFGSPYRGDFDMTFDLSPALADVNPVAMKYLYDQAAADEHRTFFVTAGGKGLNYPSQTPDVEGFMDVTVAAMTAVDHNVISVLDDTVDLAALNQMVERPEVLGLMLKTGAAYAGGNGAINWHAGKPIVSVKHTLWDGFDTPNDIIAALNGAPRDPLANQASYTIVNVHPWSTSLAGGGQGNPMSNVNHIVQNLDDAVKVVTLEELMIHLRNNFGDVVNPVFGQNLVANGDFETLDGVVANRPADWFYAATPGATQLVTGQDSDGAGQRAAAINQLNADWRSGEFEVQAGEQLEFSFDFKFVGPAPSGGFRADARFFTGPQSAGGAFAGETVEFLNASSFADGQWHTFTTLVTAPDNVEVGDVRFSTYFGPFGGGQILIDNVSLERPVTPGDFDGDGNVDDDDFSAWKSHFGTGAGADADGDGDSDGVDFLAWQRNYATTHGGGAAVAEPASTWCAWTGIVWLTLIRSRAAA